MIVLFRHVNAISVYIVLCECDNILSIHTFNLIFARFPSMHLTVAVADASRKT